MVIENMAKYKKQEKNTEFDKILLLAKALYKHINYNNVIGVKKLMEYKFIKDTYKASTLNTMLKQARSFINGEKKNYTNLNEKLKTQLQKLKDIHYATLTPREDEKYKPQTNIAGEVRNFISKKKSSLQVIQPETIEHKEEKKVQNIEIVDINLSIIKVKAICDFLVNDYKCELPGSRENREKYGKYILAKQILEMV